MRISDEWLKADRNNLTLVRLILASSVIISHSYWFVYGVEGEDSFSQFLGRPISGFAVDGFFFLSGFLVYRSLIRRHDIGDFLKARLARLWPALFVSVSFTALAGLLFTSAMGWSDYFRGATGAFLLRNLLLQGGAYTLTGVSCGEGPCVVNGSLWTIAWEVRCYVLLALLLPLGLAGERVMARVVLPLTFAGALLWHVVPHPGPEVGGVFYNLDMADRLWTMFALGIAAYIFRDRLVLSWWIALGLLAATLVENRMGIDLHIHSLLTGYVVLCAGFLTARTGAVSGRWPDYSYGIYIYAFPVMMLIGSSLTFTHYGLLALASALATLPLAALSWHYVEKPVLDGRRRRSLARRSEIGRNVAG
ncbi:MAG: acyltransferase family protein [Sphingobium sp.]